MKSNSKIICSCNFKSIQNYSLLLSSKCKGRAICPINLMILINYSDVIMAWTLNATEQERFWSRQLGSVDLRSKWGSRHWSLRLCFFYLSDWCRGEMKVKRVHSRALCNKNRDLKILVRVRLFLFAYIRWSQVTPIFFLRSQDLLASNKKDWELRGGDCGLWN